MFENLISAFYRIALTLHLSEGNAAIASESATFLVLFLTALVLYFLAWFIIKHTLIAYIHKSENNYDDVLLKNRVINRASYFVPSFIISKFAPYALPSFPDAFDFVQKTIDVYVVFVWMILISSVVSSLYDIYNTQEISKNKPIKGVIQIIKLIIYLVGGLMIIATIAGLGLGNLVIGLGTFTALLILIFKDPILGFVGGLQLSLNDMVRLGDWISMPKYGADGDVLEITLTTVKVQNWDKTITTIPTYALVSDSFTNWRGMSESGGRRVKRSLNIDMESVRFCTPEMLNKYSKFQILAPYIQQKEKEIESYNLENKIDNSSLVNGRRQTNLGIFRAYLKAFLMSHPNVNKEMTLLVRHLHPTEKGIPIEVYFFSNKQEWAEYEDLQSDVFDHVLAIIPHFDLKVFQVPSGSSIEQALIVLKEKV
ncbi:MAG: hypothetical protein CVT92_05190 [Bacteroidetes bacterium HGW-Bacteroidetes-1]|jgi:miniconductance mechanosensitive channel|nr:MAG: hypothetical protein CVT92_05190 [Bacteroidetes bacterium HGW-Bacteroidetes-1]